MQTNPDSHPTAPLGLGRACVLRFMRLFCEVRKVSAAQSWEPGRQLLAAGRLSFGEALALQTDSSLPICFLVYAKPSHVGFWAQWSGLLSLRIVSSDCAQGLAEHIETCRRKGYWVCLLTEGIPAADLEKVIRLSHSNVIPMAALDYSRLKLTRNFRHLAWRGLSRVLGSCYGPEIKAADFTADRFRRDLLEVNSRVVESHPALKIHLAEACVRGLKRRQFRSIVIDTYAHGRKFNGGMLLAAAWLLTEWIRENAREERIGIVLPPGIAAMAANLACVLCGKTPVNLNFTAGRAANEHAIRLAGVRRILTTEMVVKRIPDFPWTESRFDVVDWLLEMPKSKLLGRFLRVLITPAKWLLEELDVPEKGDQREAGILFTSGSSGASKGVVLSHRNIVGNVAQLEAVLPHNMVPSLLGSLPVFHSFGFTVMLWWPLMSGPRAVTCVSPLEVGKILEVVEKYKVALMVTTPTFLRSYLKKARPEQLVSLRMVVTGAEKLPVPLMQEFEDKMKIMVGEGYGMTEGSPAIAVNLPDWSIVGNGIEPSKGRVVGSVGRVVPGVAVRVCSPGTEDDLPISSSGMLLYRGVNIFGGYLDAPEKSAEVLKDGWYVSGDIGRMDEDGFLYIEGRLSRFSKIGGEMVPHGTIEHHLVEALRREQGEDFNLVIMGTSDAKKGESLVAIVNHPVDRDTLRRILSEQGLPNLWVPKAVKVAPVIPHLASGKLDLQACQALANQVD